MNITFLLYDSRSGSTLLSALLNCYKGVSVSQETGFIPVVLEHSKEVGDVHELDVLLQKIQGEVQYKELCLDQNIVRELLVANGFPIGKKSIIETILKYYFEIRDRDASLFVVKSPRIFYHIDTLIELFDDVKFIHIIRDGRAVFNSKINMVSVNGIKTQSNLLKAAHDWKKRIGVSEKYGDKIFEVIYEDLLVSQDVVMNSILDYIDACVGDREVTKDQADYSNIIGSKQKHLHENVKKSPDISISKKWVEELNPKDIELYEILARDDLKKRGYKLINKEVHKWGLLKPHIIIRILYYIAHQAQLYCRNIWWYIVVDKSILSKIKSKINEF